MRNLVLKARKIAALVEWPNFFFIVFSPIIAVWGTVWLIKNGGPHWATWVLMVTLMAATGIGITAGYHRLFSHCTYQASWIVRLVLLLLGGAAFEGPAREWCCAHRKHHRFVDKEGDPYNIKKGFWHAHIGWVVVKSDQSDESNIADLKEDPLVLFQDRFFIPLALLVSFGLPTALAALWGDPWGGFFAAGFLRLVVNHHLTFLINSYAHYFGKQTYSDKDSSRDSWLLPFFTYGEGYHNFHHTFSWDFRNGVRAWHFDPGKWLIKLLSWFGLTWRLQQAAPQRILEARLKMDEKRLLAKMAHQRPLRADWDQLVVRARQNLEQVHIRFLELKSRYQQLKREKAECMGEKLDAIRREMDEAQLEFKQAMERWYGFMRLGNVRA